MSCFKSYIAALVITGSIILLVFLWARLQCRKKVVVVPEVRDSNNNIYEAISGVCVLIKNIINPWSVVRCLWSVFK